jgi:small redox-active disulfide protein 2
MIIKILGTGCKNCDKLEENTKVALEEMGKDAEVVKVGDLKEIVSYGVMTSPTLVIDDKVVSTGKVLKPKAIMKMLEQ